jgi:hypothetical protein
VLFGIMVVIPLRALALAARLLFGGLACLHLIVGLPLHAALVDLALPEFRPAFLTYFAGMVELGPGWLIGHGFTPLLR